MGGRSAPSLTPERRVSPKQDDRADRGGPRRRDQHHAAGRVEGVPHVRVVLAGHRPGEGFQRGVGHLGRQHERDTEQQQAPLQPRHPEPRAQREHADHRGHVHGVARQPVLTHADPHAAESARELAEPSRRPEVVGG